MGFLNSPCLVLNKSWTPMLVLPVHAVITSLVKGDVMIMDPEDFNLHPLVSTKDSDTMSWVEKDLDSNGNFRHQPMHVVWDSNIASEVEKAKSDFVKALEANRDICYESGRKMHEFDPNASEMVIKYKTIHAVKFEFRLPEIVVHTDYNDVPDLDLKWNRKNLSIRDDNSCQYCGKKVYGKDVTVDHVLPRSRGGKNSWTNTVIACFPCNTRKRDKTPAEAGMVLRNKPVKPRLYAPIAKYTTNVTSSWIRWLPAGAMESLVEIGKRNPDLSDIS